MKFLPFLVLLICTGCAKPPLHAPGVYRLSMQDTSLLLVVRTRGDYVLHIDAPGRNTDEIRGRWNEAAATGRALSFQGLRWNGNEPGIGAGVWTASVEDNADICLDVEHLSCFVKDDAS